MFLCRLVTVRVLPPPPPESLNVDRVTGEIVPPYDATLKWQLQAAARRSLGDNHRIRICCRYIRKDWNEVQVRGSKDRRAYFAGLMACGSVWTCPVCAAKIQAARAAEARRAIDTCTAQGGSVVMASYTVPHTRSDRLSDTLDAFRKALRKLTQGAPWRRLKSLYGLSGQVSGLEVTWGESNGWHPHAHVIYFLEPGASVDLQALHAALFEQWVSACRRVGITGLSAHHAVQVQDASQVSSYLTKMGREYQWGAEHELVKSHSKKGRGERYSPFDFLRSYLDNPNDKRMLALFAEFANAFHGRNQLTWSRGLKKRLLGTDGATDQQLADSLGEEDPILAYITAEEWTIIRRRNLQPQVLQVVQEFGRGGLDNLLKGVERTDVSAKRVSAPFAHSTRSVASSTRTRRAVLKPKVFEKRMTNFREETLRL